MTKFQRTAIIASIGIVAFFSVLGLGGDYDLCDQVIISMSQEQYDSIKQLLTEQLGDEPTEREIAHWWLDHHKGR